MDRLEQFAQSEQKCYSNFQLVYIPLLKAFTDLNLTHVP